MSTSFSSQDHDADRKSRSHLGVIGVVLCAILMPLAVYIFFYREPLSTLDRISTETLSTLEQGIRDRTVTLTALQALDSQYRSLDPSVTQIILNAIPNQHQVPELIVNITQIVQKSGGVLKDFSIHESVSSKETSNQKMITTQIQLTITDIGYELLKQLIRTIHTNGRVLTIRSLEYSPEDSSVSVVLDAYAVGR